LFGGPGPSGTVPTDEPRRRRIGCLLAIVVLLLAIGAIALGALRYAPLLDDVRVAREAARRLSEDAGSMEAATLDRAAVDRLRGDLETLEERLTPVRALLAGDPLVGLARELPGADRQVVAATALLDAGASLVAAGRIGLGLAEEVVTLREANDADPDAALMPGLVEFVATSTDDADELARLIDEAEATLAGIPDDALDQIREARDLLSGPLSTYGPLLDEYRDLDDVLPGLLGRGDEKRYLILAQNPAELRPSGGYTGTVGVVTLRDGAIVEQRFVDTYDLSVQEGLPFIEPPDELADYLLGDEQSWRLADANWSADFPTVAQKAVELYGIEVGDGPIDGVIAVTTYALDRLLEVVGPVDVPEYGVEVHPGEVTMTLLAATRGTAADIEGRKDVLDALALEAVERLLSLPPERWSETVSALEDIGRQRDAMAWLADQDAQAMVDEAGWSGRVAQDPGDYLYVVESNVAPTSKYNLVVDRSDSLVVRLDEEGDARSKLSLEWQNMAGSDGEPYVSLRGYSNNRQGWYGAYLRVLTPVESELTDARGRGADRLRGVEREDVEADRAVFANYILMPPGKARMTYRWRVPHAAEETADGWRYELLIQKQPGARGVPLTVRVELPDGATVAEVSEDAVVDGRTVSLETDLTTDVRLRVEYELANASPRAAD
jgi:hypothetical protein